MNASRAETRPMFRVLALSLALIGMGVTVVFGWRCINTPTWGNAGIAGTGFGLAVSFGQVAYHRYRTIKIV